MAIRKPNKGPRRAAGSRSITAADIGPSARLEHLNRRPTPPPPPPPPPKAPLTEAQKEIRRAEREKWERRLEGQMTPYRPALIPEWIREHRFHPTRRWRFDFAWPDHRLAVEVEGLSQGRSRHTEFAGYAEDTVKYNTAALLGWRVLRFTQTQITSKEAIDLIASYFREERTIQRTAQRRLEALESAIRTLCSETQRAALHAAADDWISKEHHG